MTPTLWSRERIAALLRYAREGKSATEIGREFGLTRSAVLGKLFRIRAKEGEDVAPRIALGRPKLAAIPPKPKTAPKVPKEKASKESQRQTYAVRNLVNKYTRSNLFNPTPGVSVKPTKIKKTKRDDVDPKTPGLIRMMDLKNGMCKWPLNNAMQGEFYFCGGKTDIEKPYCKEHHAIAYVPKVEKK